MAIVANGDVEKLKSVDCSAGSIKDTEKSDQIDLSILNSIYKIKKGHKFSVAEEGAKKKTRPNSQKMTNGSSSHSSASSSPLAHPNGPAQTGASQVNGSPDSANPSGSDANQITSPVHSSTSKTPSPTCKVSRSQDPAKAPMNSAKSNASSINVRTPPPSSAPIDSAIRLVNCKQTHQPNLSAIQNGLTASPPLSTANKFSIANILNDDCETPPDGHQRRNAQQTIELPPNASSLLVPNMMLNQNDLTALSSFNLIAWQASYAAQHAQAGKQILA